MRTVNILEAKTNLSKLLESTVSSGEPFLIAKAGKPLVKVVPLSQSEAPRPRIGFMKNRIKHPESFDELARSEIEAMFSGEE